MTPSSRPHPRPTPRTDPPQRGQGRDSQKKGPRLALTLSGIFHALVLTGFLIYNSLTTHSLSAVPMFEMVQVQPKLRPLVPKTVEPPPPPEKVETRPPDAPKLTTKPKNPPATVHHEPKVVKTVEDTAQPVKEVPREAPEPTLRIVNVPSDPRLGFWASRVKKRVESLWNPPEGIAVQGLVKTVVSFQVTREGAVSDVAVEHSSGNAFLDQLAQQTISRLDQVPPIPENFPQDVLQVSYEFVYQGQ
jgi:TonB family protein